MQNHETYINDDDFSCIANFTVMLFSISTIRPTQAWLGVIEDLFNVLSPMVSRFYWIVDLDDACLGVTVNLMNGSIVLIDVYADQTFFSEVRVGAENGMVFVEPERLVTYLQRHC